MKSENLSIEKYGLSPGGSHRILATKSTDPYVAWDNIELKNVYAIFHPTQAPDGSNGGARL